jgi:SulP family sulfate permease
VKVMSFWPKWSYAPGDLWGGLASTLVALPAAIAFGVTIYSAIGPAYAACGALAGIVGATVIGLVASSLGGTPRLVSAPCAPATALLTALAIERVQHGDAPGMIVLMLILVGMLAGLIQAGLGLVGIGSLIKYIPYPVVSGFMTGVGLLIIGGQLPRFLGTPNGTRWWESLVSPSIWDWRAIVIGGVTAAVAIAAPCFTRRVPGTILGILAGLLSYSMLALWHPELRDLAGNDLVIGPLSSTADDGYLNSLRSPWIEIGQMGLSRIAGILGSALTLAVLLSIDTLKTCVLVDQLTHSRHDSNRELIAQGIANMASNAMGGISGAGTVGATLVGLSSGARSRASGVLGGFFALIAALMLGSYIAWIPVASLAGILVVSGLRMIDREPLSFIATRATMFDFVVVLAVVFVALSNGLIAAAGVGVGMAIILFVREQISGIVVHHKMALKQTSSSWHRPERERAILDEQGEQAVIFELQGNLFFGNTYQLYIDLEHEISTRSYVIIDLKRVQSIDVTAAHLFRRIRDAIQERGARLVLSGIRENHPTDRNLHEFLALSGLWHAQSKTVRLFPDLDASIAWVEDRLLGETEYAQDDQEPMQLQEMELFSRHKDETLKDLESRMEIRDYQSGEIIYAQGTPGDELYWVRRGTVRLMSTLEKNKKKPVASFARGDFFGGLAFMDNQPRPNEAMALTPTEVYVLSRQQFKQISEEHKKLAINLANAMARTLAMRLRRTELKLTMLQES